MGSLQTPRLSLPENPLWKGAQKSLSLSIHSSSSLPTFLSICSTDPFIYFPIHPPIHSPTTHPLTHPPIYSPTHLSIHSSPTHLPIHLLIHSPSAHPSSHPLTPLPHLCPYSPPGPLLSPHSLRRWHHLVALNTVSVLLAPVWPQPGRVIYVQILIHKGD